MPNTELLCLLVLTLLNSVLWIPVVIGYAKTRGPLKPEDYVRAPTTPLPDWVNRANRAHMNAVENFAPFAVTVIVATVLRVTTGLTAILAMTFVAMRIVHAIVHITGFDKAMARTVIFTISNIASVIYTVIVLLQLVGRHG